MPDQVRVEIFLRHLKGWVGGRMEPSAFQLVPCSVRCSATSSVRNGFASFMRATAVARSG